MNHFVYSTLYYVQHISGRPWLKAQLISVFCIKYFVVRLTNAEYVR